MELTQLGTKIAIFRGAPENNKGCRYARSLFIAVRCVDCSDDGAF